MSAEESAFDRWEQDRRLEDAMRLLRDMQARHEADLLETAEDSLTETETLLPDGSPAPLSWHPFYRGKAWLIDWLNDDPSCGLPKYDILIPMSQKSRLADYASDDLFPTEPSLKALRMTKRRAWGLAPYVGRPFRYMWNIGEDELGRRIAGESRIVYEDT